MQATRNALSDILDVSEEFITVDFVESADNLELIGKAAEGDADAIDALGIALAKTIAQTAAKNIEIGDEGIVNARDKLIAIQEVETLMDEIN